MIIINNYICVGYIYSPPDRASKCKRRVQLEYALAFAKSVATWDLAYESAEWQYHQDRVSSIVLNFLPNVRLHQNPTLSSEAASGESRLVQHKGFQAVGLLLLLFLLLPP